MVITKMNNVLVKHSRILFGLFTGVIIISFVWFFTPGASGNILFGSNPMSPNAVVGKAFDQNITRAELMDAMKDISLVMAVQYKSGSFSARFRRFSRMENSALPRMKNMKKRCSIPTATMLLILTTP